MLVVMDFHRFRVDVRLQRASGIRQLGQRVGHDSFSLNNSSLESPIERAVLRSSGQSATRLATTRFRAFKIPH
jgi:hypothetical protein